MTGDAEKNRVFADAFGKDPDFFAFYRSMQAYEGALKQGDTRMVLSPDSQFFQYFNDAAGASVPGTASPPKTVTPQSQPTPNVPEDDGMGDTQQGAAAGGGTTTDHEASAGGTGTSAAP